MHLKNHISKNVVLPISDIMTGQSIYKSLIFLEKSQFWEKDQIESFQNGQLRHLIHHVFNNVPYYHDLFKGLGIKPGDIDKHNLGMLPMLTKNIIRQEGLNRFLSKSDSNKNSIRCSSSGSTGEPLFYQRSKESYSINIASNLRGWSWTGYKIGDRYIKLSQNPRQKLIKRLQDRMSNNLYLSINPLIDSNLGMILSRIEEFKPKIIRCYPDPLLLLARYKRLHPEFSYNPLAITTTGNTLFPEIRSEIEEAFGCKIFDSYSCEGNSSVFECPSHTCYHSAEEYGISEVIDENGKSINKGIGRLISTDLWNTAFPFIRYDTQDYVEIDSEPCICKRNHLKVIRILGRDNDILEMENGRKFIVHNFTGFFQTDISALNRSIDQFQVIKDGSRVTFKIVVNNRFNLAVSDFVKKYWENEMSCPVEVEVVKSIPLLNNGKRKFIINL